jgi:Methyltransferase domain
MAIGERAAIEGLLAALRPQLAIEVGTARGGSLERIAAYSDEVHTFDLAPAAFELPANVTQHVGDSHVLLRELLAELAAAGRTVDFALVDGDHTRDGVRRDLGDLLASPAARRTVIVLHDLANESVRAGVREVDFASFPGVVYVDLGFVELAQTAGPLTDHWGGLGLVVVDPERTLLELTAEPPVIREASARATPLRRTAMPLRRAQLQARQLLRRARGS